MKKLIFRYLDWRYESSAFEFGEADDNTYYFNENIQYWFNVLDDTPSAVISLLLNPELQIVQSSVDETIKKDVTIFFSLDCPLLYDIPIYSNARSYIIEWSLLKVKKMNQKE